MKKDSKPIEMRLIESDGFPFEFLSQRAERESWRKEVHRPIYHVHKWWAKRLGSVFRGILLGCALPMDAGLEHEFYQVHDNAGKVVFDPFMGSGTTVGEAHKLGFTALGRDINPVAARAVSTAFGPLDRREVVAAFQELAIGAGKNILELYKSTDSKGRHCDVLYFFHVMQVPCPECSLKVDLFPSFVIARNAYPERKPEVQIVCPACGDIFSGMHGQTKSECRSCGHRFDPRTGTARGAKGTCSHCRQEFSILKAVGRLGRRPDFRLFGKLILTIDGGKEYLPVSAADLAAHQQCSELLNREVGQGRITLPKLTLQQGYNTKQAMGYGFLAWRDFFTDRQLLALGWLQAAINELPSESSRNALRMLFSGTLEFNNLFASYKGEGTGAVRHMFSHHILKPERTPIEANVWGTPKSSGSFSNLLAGRILRAIEYRLAPTEVQAAGKPARVCALPFSGRVEANWPVHGNFVPRGVYVSCGDSAVTGLPKESVDLVVTDPPFFDNVNYSELADFFHAWHNLDVSNGESTTRRIAEVQDGNAGRFAQKLLGVFRECGRLLKEDGLLVFSYHHSRNEGWEALAEAILGSGFVVVNSHPVKAELSVATPKSQAKEPIQLDIVVVCRKTSSSKVRLRPSVPEALASAKAKLNRLRGAGFTLSRNDQRITLCGQLLTTLNGFEEAGIIENVVEQELESLQSERLARPQKRKQHVLFDDA